MASTREEKAPHLTIGIKKDGITYTERHAVRIIIQNPATARIALIHVTKGSYYKLPGGGIEGDEDHKLAITREALEETGCEVDISSECIATTEEYRNDLHQFSHCYKATLRKDTGAVELTEDEIEDGLAHEWVTVDEAKKRMAGAEPTNELGVFIQERDLFFLKVAFGE